MPLDARKKVSVSDAVVPVRALFFRLSIVFFCLVSIAILIISRVDHDATKDIRTKMMDIAVPVLSALTSPVETYHSLQDKFDEVLFLYQENNQLRYENQRLKRLEHIAVALEAENERLRELLNMFPEPRVAFITARVVGDTGGAYSRSVMINIGNEQGVKEGQIVTTQAGLVGRITDVGSSSARVLLMTDLNSRVPVMTEKSRERSVLAGNNSPMPYLTHMPDDSNIRIGERVMTSGDGHFFPAGIPAGTVHSIEGLTYTVKPLIDWNRLDYVTITDPR